jgi:uncharacterized protein (DUF1919 family)
MNKSGPIIVIEDDIDDQEILIEIFENLGYKNKIIFFMTAMKRWSILTKAMCSLF